MVNQILEIKLWGHQIYEIKLWGHLWNKAMGNQIWEIKLRGQILNKAMGNIFKKQCNGYAFEKGAGTPNLRNKTKTCWSVRTLNLQEIAQNVQKSFL